MDLLDFIMIHVQLGVALSILATCSMLTYFSPPWRFPVHNGLLRYHAFSSLVR